jgi:carboxyl-terminal processing protease
MTTGKWFTPAGRSIHRDRKLMADGRYVEVEPDSMEQDSVRHARPTYNSDAGRIVYGGGGITPDVIVAPDTLSTVEQEFLRALAPKGAVVATILRELALELKSGVTRDFVAPASWSATLERRLTAAGVVLDARHRAAGMAMLSGELESRVARIAFGDAQSFSRDIGDDRQLGRALALLRAARTQSDLFAAAKR